MRIHTDVLTFRDLLDAERIARVDLVDSSEQRVRNQRPCSRWSVVMPTIAEHNARLRKAGLPTVETLTRRILDVFDRATPADIEAGASWYNEARALAAELSREHDIEHAAAVIAHLSPRTTWTRNVAGATALMIDGTRANGIIGRNFDKALEAYNAPTADLLETFGGPKTRRFFLNILGDVEAVTVDVWAARVAGIDEDLLSRVGVYDAVEAAYQRAARRVGLDPATMQATTWIVARGGRAS